MQKHTQPCDPLWWKIVDEYKFGQAYFFALVIKVMQVNSKTDSPRGEEEVDGAYSHDDAGQEIHEWVGDGWHWKHLVFQHCSTVQYYHKKIAWLINPRNMKVLYLSKLSIELID